MKLESLAIQPKLLYTEPLFEAVPFRILIKRPVRQNHFYKFITVLEPRVWLCVIGALCLTSVVLAFFDRYSPYSARNSKLAAENEENRIFDLKESFWFCTMSLTPQGGGNAPRAFSSKLVSATWWLFGFIVIASYTANLAAFLTVSRLNKQITSLEQLSKQYKIRYAPQKKSAANLYFKKLNQIEEHYYEYV